MGCNGGRPSFELSKLSKLCFCPAFVVCTTDAAAAAVTAAGCRIIVLSFSQDPKIPKNHQQVTCGCCRVNSAHSVQGAAAELCSEAESSLGLRPYWGWGSVGLSPHPGLTLISLTALLERHAPLWLH